MAVCSKCHSLYVPHKLSKSDLCPGCVGKSAEFVLRCSFCDAEWVSKKEGWAVCPVCGFKRPDDSDDIRRLWSDGDRCLKYVRDGDFKAVYLWKQFKPVAAITVNEACGVEDALVKKQYSSLAHYLEVHADDCVEKNRNLMSMLNLSEQDYLFLAYHFDGMSPEALALKFDVKLEIVRRSFDRIMNAFSNNGIPVNDNKYTENPQAEYEKYADCQADEIR